MSEVVLHVETGLDSCFSAEQLIVELRSTESSALLRSSWSAGVGAAEGALESRPISPELAAAYIARVEAILGRPQATCGGRSTTRYHASVRRGDVPGPGDVAVSSMDLPREALAEIAGDPSANPALAARMQKLLDAGIHDWAHEIYAATRAFLSAIDDDTRGAPAGD
jgi:hypothetical protein